MAEYLKSSFHSSTGQHKSPDPKPMQTQSQLHTLSSAEALLSLSDGDNRLSLFREIWNEQDASEAARREIGRIGYTLSRSGFQIIHKESRVRWSYTDYEKANIGWNTRNLIASLGSGVNREHRFQPILPLDGASLEWSGILRHWRKKGCLRKFQVAGVFYQVQSERDWWKKEVWEPDQVQESRNDYSRHVLKQNELPMR